MSYLLPHLNSGWAVDQAILSEENRVVVIRFGHDWDPACMQMDEVKNALLLCCSFTIFLKQLFVGIADKVKSFAALYLVRFFLTVVL